MNEEMSLPFAIRCNTDFIYLFICLANNLPDTVQSGKKLLFMAINIIQLEYIKGM